MLPFLPKLNEWEKGICAFALYWVYDRKAKQLPLTDLKLVREAVEQTWPFKKMVQKCRSYKTN